MVGQRSDGSILSAALTGGIHRQAVEKDYGLHRCMVIKVYYVDDQGNLTFENRQVTYDLLILGGRKEGQIIANAKAAGSLGGGVYNTYERIYRATQYPFSGAGAKPLSEHDGDIVYVQFIDGNTSLPIIVGSAVQSQDKDRTGAKKSDGHIFKEEYNGIKKSIDKNGNYTLEKFGGQWNSDAGFFKPNDQVETTISVKKDEKVSIELKSGMNISIDGKQDTAQITAAGGASLKIAKDKVGLGGASAELLEEVSKALQEIISHMEDLQVLTVPGNLGYPTGTPVNASSYSGTASALSAIKSLIDGIKGGI